jgi:hypothetical protein
MGRSASIKPFHDPQQDDGIAFLIDAAGTGACLAD